MSEPQINVRIQAEDFSLDEEYQQLRQQGQGAIVTFTGIVRDYCQVTGQPEQSVSGIFLEHYPGMTEKAIKQICQQAAGRWQTGAIRVIHRIGQLPADAQIVMVGVSCQHRQGAFEAAQFIMDVLKNQVPIWKKELTPTDSHWVEAKQSDLDAGSRWID